MVQATRGLYEVLITEALEGELRELDAGLLANRDSLRASEAADRIALHLARVIERAIAAIDDKQRASVGIELACRLIDLIRTSGPAGDLGTERPVALG